MSQTNAITSRVFRNGNSQAVRIPQSFRLDTERVAIFRNSDGDLVLHPIPEKPEKRGTALLKVLHALDAEWVVRLEENRAAPLPMQERDWL